MNASDHRRPPAAERPRHEHDGFWDDRYRSADTPWDLGSEHPRLAEILTHDPALGQMTPGRAVVPGCGRGWDAAALARAGWDVVGLDVSPAALSVASHLHPEVAFEAVDALDGVEVLRVCGGQVDLLWDHTFFCALPPAWRPRFGVMAAAVVKPGGRLVSIVFPIGREPHHAGPPFAMTVEDVDAVLPDDFELVEVHEPHQIDSRAWPGRLAVWRRAG